MKIMKQLFILILFCLGLSFSTFGQEDINPFDKSENISLGIQINSLGSDFGWGLHLTSPFFAKKKLAVQLSANAQYYEHVDTAMQSTVWSPYWVFQLGLIAASTTIKDFLRLYSHTGGVVALPNKVFSDKVVDFGVYTKLGVEFLFNANKKALGSYFLEGGWIGIFSKANLLPNSPIYGNGFMASTGVRFYF